MYANLRYNLIKKKTHTAFGFLTEKRTFVIIMEFNQYIPMNEE